MEFEFHRLGHLVWLETSPPDQTIFKTVYLVSCYVLHFFISPLFFLTLVLLRLRSLSSWNRKKIRSGTVVNNICKLYNSTISENSWLVLMKNTINISYNVNLILNTYRCLFFSNFYWEPSMRFDGHAAMQDNSASWQDSVEIHKLSE